MFLGALLLLFGNRAGEGVDFDGIILVVGGKADLVNNSAVIELGDARFDFFSLVLGDTRFLQGCGFCLVLADSVFGQPRR